MSETVVPFFGQSTLVALGALAEHTLLLEKIEETLRVVGVGTQRWMPVLRKTQELIRLLDKASEISDCSTLLFGGSQYDRRTAAERLADRYQPYPFKKRAVGVLKILFAPSAEKNKWHEWQTLRDLLVVEMLEAANVLAQASRTWRFKRKWVKDSSGRVVELTLSDINLAVIPCAVKTLCINAYEHVLLKEWERLHEVQIQDRDVGTAAVSPECPIETDELEILSRNDESELELVERSDFEAASLLRQRGDQIGLSPRENEIVELLRTGLSRRQIVQKLNLRPATLRVHLRNIRLKVSHVP
jgi:DNA-binding CsgD family transcriptional regulator